MDSYFVDLLLKGDYDDYFPVYFGLEEGSPHNVLVGLFVDEQEAWDYCSYKNNLEDFSDLDADSETGYEDVEYDKE